MWAGLHVWSEEGIELHEGTKGVLCLGQQGAIGGIPATGGVDLKNFKGLWRA